MEAFSYEAFQRNPELLQALLIQARRERAEALHRLIVSPFRRLFSRFSRFDQKTACTA